MWLRRKAKTPTSQRLLPEISALSFAEGYDILWHEHRQTLDQAQSLPHLCKEGERDLNLS